MQDYFFQTTLSEKLYIIYFVQFACLEVLEYFVIKYVRGSCDFMKLKL